MIKLVNKYLDLSNYLNVKESFEEFFLSHPNYPSIYAITDSLDMLSIENVALKIPKEQLLELPDSFLASYTDEMVLVIKDKETIHIETKEGNTISLSFADFMIGWDGVIIAIEPDGITFEKSIVFNTEWIKYSLIIIGLLGYATIRNNYTLIDFGFLVLSIIGLVFSVFIVQEKLGIKNEIVSKFCNSNANSSCDAVIKSNKSEINKWVSFSDLPLLFFGVNIISIFLLPVSSQIVGLLSLVSFPLLGYSIWIQKVQLKKWCLLCLAVSFVIFLQGTLFALTFLSGFLFDFPNLFFYGLTFISVSTLWFWIRGLLKSKYEMEKNNSELKKFKRNYNLFAYLSKEVPVLIGFDKLEGMNFGNPMAEVRLSLFLSPSCGHCHKAFQDAFELVSKYPERVFLNVLFNVNPENDENPYKTVVESLLEIHFSKPDRSEEAISDWHIRKIGLEAWQSKWQVKTIGMKVNLQIEKQYQWCLENEFNYTPVKIINDNLFPNEYDISELKYFINDFSEEVEILEADTLVRA